MYIGQNLYRYLDSAQLLNFVYSFILENKKIKAE